MNRLQVDSSLCEALIQRGSAGDVAACQALVDHLWPKWLELVRASRGIQLLPSAEDGVHEVVAILVEKLSRPDARGFQLYLPWRQRNPDKAFEDWLGIITQNTIRDYLREHVGSQPSTSSEPNTKLLLNEFAAAALVEGIGVRSPATLAQMSRELVEYARTRLPPRAFSVLQTWLASGSVEGAAAESTDEARQLLRSALVILRRQFSRKASS
ncbi:MAG TPA: hypothetical protein VKP30_04965 [Polyangiaceae bacterium]|nr:hypothetical protein [Polyangiaceae bacterium]